MNKRNLLLTLALPLLLAACGGGDAPATDRAANTVAPAAAPAATAPAEAIADEPALDPDAPPAAQTPVDAAAPATEGADAQVPPAAATAASTAVPGLIVGQDYDVIPNGQPFEPLNGKIEVVEVFNYVCPACAMFQPLVNAWKPRLPADVRFTYVPAAFGPRWDPYVRAYYTAESMGVADRTHDAIFKAIHVDRKLKGERGEDSPQDIAEVYAGFGVDEKQFVSTMSSFAVNAKFNRARQFIARAGANSTPMVIVNGKYRVKGRSWEDLLRIADVLIAHERTAAATP